MRVYNRKLKILRELIECDGYLTSEFLSQKIKVSSRTIRDDVKRLGIDLEKESISFFSIPGKGYRIDKQDKDKARSYYSRKIEEDKEVPTIPKNRVDYILKTLLFASEPITIEELSDQLIVSISTIEKDFVNVEKWFASQNLKLIKKPLTGIWISGTELALRYAMVNYFLEQQGEHSRKPSDFLAGFMTDKRFNQVLDIIDNAQKLNGFYLSDSDYKHLCIYISIALMRISNNNAVSNSAESTSRINTTLEFKIANQIGMELQTALDIDFPQDEITSIAQYLMQANLIDEHHNLPKAIDIITPKEISEFINNTVSDVEEQFSVDFLQDNELIRGLETNLSSLLATRKHKINLKTPSLEEIKTEYPNELEMAIMVSKTIKRNYQIDLSEDEIGDFALYFCAAIERQKIANIRTPLRVIIICSSGISGSQLLATKIKRYFPHFVIEGVYPAYRLPEARKKQPDLMISTDPLEEENIPVIQVSHIFSNDDFNSIHNFLNDLNSIGDLKDKEAFIKLFNPKLFISGIELNQREEVIKLLCSVLVEYGYADDGFKNLVLERERMFSTAIGNLVAIPHAFPGDSSDSQIAVGILRKPILWGKDKVQLVFLLNIQNSLEEEFAKIYEYFYDIIDSHSLIKKLVKTDNFDQFIQLMP